jgi:hypothetical protein
VGGGKYNRARGEYSAVAGGGGANAADSNYAGASYSTISGGSRNDAQGAYSMIPGGYDNYTGGNYCFAAGNRAKSIHTGCFVWGDASPVDISSVGNNLFMARATGGVRFYTNSVLTNGAILAPGGGAWSTFSDSTKKANVRLVDSKEILKKLESLPIKQWSYESQDPSIEHIGPMAQDFWNVFQLGECDTMISTIDPDGVALAAIQELAKQNDEKDNKIADLEARVKQLEAAILQFGLLNKEDKH